MFKVCFISASVYGYFNDKILPGGGAQRQLSLLAHALTDSFEVSFVVGDYGQPEHETRADIELYRSYRPDPDTAVHKKPVQLWSLRNAMARPDADIYIYRGHPWKAAFTYALAKSLGKPWVYNLANDPNIEEQPANLPTPVRWLFERALSDADAIIAQTPKQTRRLKRKYGVQAETVPNGYPVDVEVRSHHEREYFLWVGRIDQTQKQPHCYLDLAEQVESETFMLVGPDGQDETYNERIRTRAASLDNVVDRGTVPPDEIHDLYRDAIALVNTSAHEGFPNTFLEAWRYETPVISLTVDPGRFVGPDVNGCADGDLEDLVTLTRELARDPSLRESLGSPAGAYVRSELSIEAVAEEYGAVLRDVCAE